MRRFSTAITITDPLVKYQSMVATGILSPDPAQHRLALHLRTLYSRIKDYSPHHDYSQRIRQTHALIEPEQSTEDSGGNILAVRTHSIWRNPFFKHLLSTPEGQNSLALTRVLANYEEAINIDSPKGLFLSGEVGTGKSMLLNLLADGLPTHRKRRWHFNTFMLHTMAQLESYRNMTSASRGIRPEHSLLWMAKKLVDESPVLFLDEFQLPDRAASKILSHLFIAYFQMGGVLIASSNRMPEDLEKATGVDYSTEPKYGMIQRLFGNKSKDELYGGGSDFSKLLEVLKARCDFWQMEGGQDWRRREQVELNLANDKASAADESGNIEGEAESEETKATNTPHAYVLTSTASSDDLFLEHTKVAASWANSEPIPWQPKSLVVYGRQVNIPKHFDGVVTWDFEDLVQSFGPADYITMASSFHTFAIDNVPVLTILQKNEARRFITFLDAIYESRCKLVIRAKSSPDTLFFPTTKTSAAGRESDKEGDDATYSETISEVYQDQMSPFRPNISYYDTPSSTSTYDPDQDSDFGLQKRPVDFSNTSAFTGEDERFAYKRAASRLWEMCGARWHAREGNWWQPLPPEARHWEGGQASIPLNSKPFAKRSTAGEVMGETVDADGVAGLSKYHIEHLRKKSGE